MVETTTGPNAKRQLKAVKGEGRGAKRQQKGSLPFCLLPFCLTALMMTVFVWEK
jgi:hypothetical protein